MVTRDLICGRVLSRLRVLAAEAAPAAVWHPLTLWRLLESGSVLVSLDRLTHHTAQLQVAGLDLQAWEVVGCVEMTEALLEQAGIAVMTREDARTAARQGDAVADLAAVDEAILCAMEALDLDQWRDSGAEE